jgi:CheY-like chemotaxis protein
VIADIGIRGIDGLQLIRAIRQMEGSVASIPAAALTGYARARDRITSFASGFPMHLVKPIDPLELIVRLRPWRRERLVDRTRRSREDR